MRSYSAEMKECLCLLKSNAREHVAELAGLLYFCEKYADTGIVFSTSCRCVADRFVWLADRVCDVDLSPYLRVGKGGRRFFVETSGQVAVEMSEYIPFAENADFSFYIEEENAPAFIRGIFLAAGYVSNPEKELYAEISITDERAIEGVLDLFSSLDTVVRVSHRDNGNFFYFKTCDDISGLLFYMGAKKQSFDYVNADIYRTLRNDANRAANCDVANAKKQADSARKQIHACKLLKKCKYNGISPELAQTAEMRLQHPDMSIEQLGLMFEPAVSKSGMAYRLNKIIKYAEKLTAEE